jgi:phosphoserine aminotransferase
VTRYHNFSAGPGALPLSVLESAHAEFIDMGHGASILESSHRSPEFTAVLDSANTRLRALASIPDTHDILWLQGGASMQFAMLPLNFLSPGKVGSYVLTGTWSDKALAEASIVGETHVVASSKDSLYNAIPARSSWDIPSNSAYVHTTSNNTIYGTQFASFPTDLGTRHVCDMSSDILCRPMDVSGFDMIYAGAQKNLGPAGVALAKCSSGSSPRGA